MESDLFAPRSRVPVSGAPAGLDSWCVVTTDPTGFLIKPAGTIAYHIGGVLAWLNVDGTAAGWRTFAALGDVLERESWGAAGTFGANVTSFDVTGLACDTRGGFHVRFRAATVAAGASIIFLRLNGSTANFAESGWYTTAGAPPNLFGDVNAPHANLAGAPAGAPLDAEVWIASAASGRHRFGWWRSSVETTPGVRQLMTALFTWQSLAEIASVGIESTAANDLAAASQYVVTRVR